MLILLWGLPDEAPVAAVAHALREAGTGFVLLDQRQVLSTRVRLCVTTDVRGSIHAPDVAVQLEEVASAYVRPYDSGQLQAVADAPRQRTAKARAAAVDSLLLTWCDLSPGLVLNRPRQMASNNCKPYQAEFIRRAGFSSPRTLITTSPVAVRAFAEQHGTLIYKSISGIRSRVARFEPAQAERLSDVATCPTQFQQFVPGCDFRAHVVGDRLFASELLCDADDYRYPGDHSLNICSARLPPDVEEQCFRLAASLDLSLAGIDLRRTPDGEWFCFEANPSPAFTFYENATGQPIASAIASMLASRLPGYVSPQARAESDFRNVTLLPDPLLRLAPASIWSD